MTPRRIIFTLCWLMLIIVPVLAQAACPALVNQALDAVGDNCADLDRNTACYGYDRVDTLFATPQPADFFSRPTDRTELANLQTIKTFPLDTDTGRFGVAVMNVQADVPNSLPGQGVFFMLVGDAELNNAVAPEDAVTPADPVDVTAAVDTPLFSLPSDTSNTRRDVKAGAALQTDGFNATGDWLRIVSDNDIAWIPVGAITPDAVLDGLPTLSSTNKTPMQAFYFSTGVGQPACNEAEASIAIQSPENITVDLTVNGVDIQVGSLVTMTNNTITVHRGHVSTSFGQDINANETMDVEKDENGNFVGDGSVREISDEEYERGQRTQDAINKVADSNGWDEREITERDEQPPNTETLPDGSIAHVVQPGESLFSIAVLYNASMKDIADANNLTEPFVIYRGQRLTIPNPGGGFENLPLQPRPPATQEVTDNPNNPDGNGTGDGNGNTGNGQTGGTLDCAGFQITGGGGGILSTFSWTAVDGADQYKINLTAGDGSYVTSIFVAAPSTSVDVNMGDYSTGDTFQWEVEALRNGTTFCKTGRSASAPKPVARPQQPNATAAPFAASRICASQNDATVFWSGAANGSIVTVFGADSYMGPDYKSTFTTTSGTVPVTVPASLVLIQVYSDKGDFMNLPGCP